MKRNVSLAFAGVLVLAVAASAVWAGSKHASGTQIASGVAVGDTLAPFRPMHVAGPDAGTNTCPVCKYGARPAVQVWFNSESMKSAAPIAQALDKAVADNSSADLKAFVVFIRHGKGADSQFASQLKDFAAKNKLQRIGVTYVSAPTDAAVREYQINTNAKVQNTVFVYKDRTVASKFVNLRADTKGLDQLTSAIHTVVTD
jgi:hypothetical protein